MSNKSIKAPTTPNKILNPSQYYVATKASVRFSRDCLKQEKITFNHGKIVNIYIVYKIDKTINISSYATLGNCLFGAVKLTKYVEFDRWGFFSHPSGGTGKNVIIFGVDISSTRKIDNRKKDTLIIVKGPTQGLENTLSGEKMYSINFTKENVKFGLSLHYNGANSYLFINGEEIHKFTPRDSEFIPYELCSGNISKDWSIDKCGLWIRV